MYEGDLRKMEFEVDVPPELSQDFPEDLWFSLIHSSDPKAYRYSLGWFSVKEGKIRYWSMVPKGGVGNLPSPDFAYHPLALMHGLIPDYDRGTLIAFRFETDYFNEFDLRNCSWKAYSSKVFGSNSHMLGSTFFEDPSNAGKYLACYSDWPGIDAKVHYIVVSKDDPTDFEEFSTVGNGLPSHMVRPGWDGKVFASMFARPTFRFSSDGEEVSWALRFRARILMRIFENFARERSIPVSDANKYLEISFKKPSVPMAEFAEFISWFKSRYPEVPEAQLWRLMGQNYELLGGDWYAIDRTTGKSEKYVTPAPTPWHFEYSPDPKKKEVYVSCHNFIAYPKYFYYGPAVIAKYAQDESTKQMVLVGTASDPKGYRYTSHRLFDLPWFGECVATIGQPNRLYVYSSETMEKVFHMDLGRNRMDESTDEEYARLVNSKEPLWVEYVAFEISKSGRHLAAYSHEGLRFFDLIEKKLVWETQFLPQSFDPTETGWNWALTHSQSFRRPS